MKRVFADQEMCYRYDPSNPNNPPSVTATCGITEPVGKRQAIRLCDACCNYDNCNHGTCKEIQGLCCNKLFC